MMWFIYVELKFIHRQYYSVTNKNKIKSVKITTRKRRESRMRSSEISLEWVNYRIQVQKTWCTLGISYDPLFIGSIRISCCNKDYIYDVQVKKLHSKV